MPGGHRVAATRLRARFNTADWIGEQTGGVSQLFFLRELAARIDTDWPGVLAQLERVRAALVNRNSMICNVTLDAQNWDTVAPKLEAFGRQLPAAVAHHQSWIPAALPPREGLTIPAQVNYVAKGANLYDLGYRLHGSSMVVNNLLSTTWLWERVRVQGGA